MSSTGSGSARRARARRYWDGVALVGDRHDQPGTDDARPSLLVTAAALPHVRGLSPARSTTTAPPRPAPTRSADDEPSPTPAMASRQPGRTRAVPAFTVIRSTKEEPSSISAACHWPRHDYPAAHHLGLPGRHPHDCPEVPRPDFTGTGAQSAQPYPPGLSRFTFRGT
jgi:hypothetical protein